MAYKALQLRLAVSEVLKAPARWDTLFVYEGALAATPPPAADAASLEMVRQPVGALVHLAVSEA